MTTPEAPQHQGPLDRVGPLVWIVTQTSAQAPGRSRYVGTAESEQVAKELATRHHDRTIATAGDDPTEFPPIRYRGTGGEYPGPLWTRPTESSSAIAYDAGRGTVGRFLYVVQCVTVWTEDAVRDEAAVARTLSLVEDTEPVPGEPGEQARRDQLGLVLASRIGPDTPVDGDRVRVRLRHGEGSTLEGRWEHLGGEGGAALRLDDGSLHPHVAEHVEHVIVHRAPRPLLALLTDAEARVVAALLDELAAIYPGEPLGGLARAMADGLADRLWMR
jgi:hypothetical protein